jgi:hypothetical protein
MDKEDIIKIRGVNRNFAMQFTWDSAYEKWLELVKEAE